MGGLLLQFKYKKNSENVFLVIEYFHILSQMFCLWGWGVAVNVGGGRSGVVGIRVCQDPGF